MREEEVATADSDVRYIPYGKTMDFCGVAHETRYDWVLNKWDLDGKSVLDFGCGSGYGSYMLAKKAKTVDGIDYSSTAIAYAKATYLSANLRFFVVDACTREVFTILKEKHYDIVVSFDVIEHIERYFDYLQNIRQLLRDDGFAVIGCPNRLQVFEWNNNWNRFHFQEFSPYQLRRILGMYFEDVLLVSQDFKDKSLRESVRASLKRPHSGVLSALAEVLPDFAKPLARRVYSLVTRTMTAHSMDLKYQDIEFTIEPGDTMLNGAFGLVAICSNRKSLGDSRT